MDVGVDFHGRVHKGMAKQLARLLEPHQPLFIEGELVSTFEYVDQSLIPKKNHFFPLNLKKSQTSPTPSRPR